MAEMVKFPLQSSMLIFVAEFGPFHFLEVRDVLCLFLRL
jgi:hypothetical protein